jgi:glycosyltransferase involved in cell wall biosynthesis
MYPLDRADSGPTVRIRHIRDALAELVRLDVVAGYRSPRARDLARYAVSGRLRGLDGIYVESSSFLPSPGDVAFLGLARGLGIPVLTFVRDAYQLFPEYRQSGSLKERVSLRLFMPALRSLSAVSSQMAFPSRGLAAAVGHATDGRLLPPGASAPVDVPRKTMARQLLHVGALRSPALGGELLLEAVARARASGHEVELTLVCRPSERPTGTQPSWLHTREASGDEILALLPDARASVIPRRETPYNDLAIPVKLMEYLSYGRPLLVTDCTEQARIVREAGCGLVVNDDVDGFAAGISQLFDASEAQLDAWSAAAAGAARANSWHARAEQVLEILSLAT